MYIYLKKCIKNTLILIIMLETCEIYYYIVYILPIYRHVYIAYIGHVHIL